MVKIKRKGVAWRLPMGTKAEVEQFAADADMSVNAAAVALLQSGLEAQNPGNMLLYVGDVREALIALGSRMEKESGPMGRTIYAKFRAATGSAERAHQVMGALMVVNLAPNILDGSVKVTDQPGVGGVLDTWLNEAAELRLPSVGAH